jgi:hypothetical protein
MEKVYLCPKPSVLITHPMEPLASPDASAKNGAIVPDGRPAERALMAFGNAFVVRKTR